MVFQQGHDQGKQRTSPRARIVSEIVGLFTDNIELIKEGLKQELIENPVKAYTRYLFPLLPKNIELSNDNTEQFNLVINKTYVKEGDKVEID